jgi:4-hydroxy-2,2'-bipyrrole-5-carbaldehyde O-methyltransferase
MNLSRGTSSGLKSIRKSFRCTASSCASTNPARLCGVPVLGSKWGVGARATVEAGDIRNRTPSGEFDLAMLNNNIYYFPVGERAALIRHVAGFLKAGGTLLIITPCPRRNIFYAVLDLWGAGTEGCGRLPYRDELRAQLRDAGMIDCQARSIIAGGGYYAFAARRA